MKTVLISLLFSSLASISSAADRAVMEGVPASVYTMLVSTKTPRVFLDTTTYSGSVANVGMFCSSNVVIGGLDSTVYYATGTIMARTLTASSALNLANNTPLQAADSAGSNRQLMILDASNNFQLGTTQANVFANVLVKPGATTGLTVTPAGSLSVDGTATVQSSMTVNGAQTLTGALNAGGSITTQSSMTVNGAALITGLATLNNSLTVQSSVTVQGATTIGSFLAANGPVTTQSSVTINGAATMTGAFNAVGSITTQSSMTVNGAQTMTGALNVGGSITTQSSMTVNGAQTMTGALNAGGSITTQSSMTVNGAGGLLSPAISSGTGGVNIMGAWGSWTPAYTGFSVNPSGGYAVYIQIGKLVIAEWTITAGGTSNSTLHTITLPVAATRTTSHAGNIIAVDNGAAGVIGRLDTRAGSNVADIYRDPASDAWTASGSSYVIGQTMYEAQ